MRAGLITFHFAHHYGAQLQAYATMRAIQPHRPALRGLPAPV